MTLKTITSHSNKRNLIEWLSYLETIHATEIDLGLARISQVAELLSIDLTFAKVITVAGTNGKGTTCAFLETALLTENKKVAVYSSPHIEHFNERLRVNKQDIEDDYLINAFELIEEKRGAISLTYYEYTTLAAFIVLMEIQPDYIILEVGLGGRLDATNIIDADIAVITSIDLDHQAFLGDTREAIGREKAGIMRGERLSVVGDLTIPQSILDYANSINTQLFQRGEAFNLSQTTAMQWQSENITLTDLHIPHIPSDNVATALMVLELLSINLFADRVNEWIDNTKVAGRTEIFRLKQDVMLDVGHNPHAARYLAGKIQDMLSKNKYQKVLAVVGMFADKDIKGTLAPLKPYVSHWYFGTLQGNRAAAAPHIAQQLMNEKFNCFDNVTQAFTMAQQEANSNDLILVFGSFFTVADIRRLILSTR